jgi:hypothetical protein
MPLRDYPLDRKYDPQIAYNGTLADEIPEYECREAARFALYNWTEWQDLSVYERAAVIAHYRESNRMEANLSDASEKASKNKSK